MTRILKNFHLSWDNFIQYLPALLGGIVCFALTIILANFFSKIASNYSLKRSKDSLVANFVGKIIWAIIFILGTVLALGILGLGTISDKILAGAGITTFVVGFALKDIGENFLAGLILAFSRPYRVGNLIECEKVKGVVQSMTLRQTTIEAENGKIILVPNSMIIKNPLIKYQNDDNNLRQEFSLNIESKNVKQAEKIIKETLESFDYVLKSEDKPVKVIVDSLTGGNIKLLVIFWFGINKFKGSKSGSKSDILMAVFDSLEKEGIKYSG
ncbi:MAG: mechanosensitive ion channel family protein [Bacteroidota bacterium]